jgi:mevalonate kinase
MGYGQGFGKVILFGEHFVNYGTPGIVSAISLVTQAEIRHSPDGPLTIHDHRRGTPGYIEAKREQQRDSLLRILDALHLNTPGLEIWLGGPLPVYSGIGASAASCVAVARALADEFGLDVSDSEINTVAYEGEKAYHGPTHAGLDNLAATYGGVLWYLRGSQIFYEPLQLKMPFQIVLGNTGIVANTHELIAGVAQRKAADPARYDLTIQQARAIATAARDSLEHGDLETVGKLMDQNHTLLQSIEVSCPELDAMVEIARRAGALGAKSTGGGGGGCMLALTPSAELQERVALALESAGFEVLRAWVGEVTVQQRDDSRSYNKVQGDER